MGMPPLEYKKMKKGGLPIILIQYLLHPGRCGIGIANLATEFQQLALHLFDFTGISGGIVDVMVFVGVGQQIVELPRRRDESLIRSGRIQRIAVEEHQFVAMVADAHVGGTDLVVRPVAVVHGLPPVARSLALQIVAEAAAFAARRGVHPGIVGQRSGKINIEDDVGIARPGRDLLRVADNERHAKRLLVHHALVEKAMLAEEITLVGDIDYDRILGQPLFVKETQQAADIVMAAPQRK